MIHIQLEDSSISHYAVGKSGTTGETLLQLGDSHGEQVRVCLTDKEALDIAMELILKVREKNVER